MKKILYLLLLFIPVIALPQMKQDINNIEPNVYLIGVIHARHFDSKYNYSLADVLEQVKALKPDLVCGEITPEAFDKPMEGFFPPEAAMLAEMADELNYRFEPVDWRLDYATQALANKDYPQSVKEKTQPIIKRLNDDLENLGKKSAYDYLHEKSTLQSLDIMYEEIICVNTVSEIASGNWNERSRRIVENTMTAAGDARTIVIVFGIDHLPQLQRYFKEWGIEAKIPERMFVPNNQHKVSETVLNRWKKNLENLISIRDKKINSSYDDYKKVTNSNRIKDIEKAINSSL
ncbi:hypothetical protein [Prevotella sp. 10(H)]|uniref:hypothetical protein n=1 Tax=Prevotella sp. 10(H) TaxID=1158294 RepID=UPI0004A73C2A|nr:hypothetical protein [Prevotella sp. 10(H)]